MFIIGKVDWFGDKKAKLEGRDGDYGYVTSLDNEIQGSFKLYKDQIKENDTLGESYIPKEDDIVIFSPGTKKPKPKAFTLYRINSFPYLNELKQILRRSSICHGELKIYLDLFDHFDGLNKEQAEILCKLVNNEGPIRIGSVLPYIGTADDTKLSTLEALNLLSVSYSNDNNDEAAKKILASIILSDVDELFDKFERLSIGQKYTLIHAMPFSFIYEHRQYERYLADSQREYYSDYCEGREKEEEAKREKERIEKLLEIAKNHNIDYFVHFTRLENLDSIIQRGIITRSELNFKQISYQYTDENRFDNQLNTISLSVSFPNYKMLHYKRQQNPDAKWCVLLMKPESILKKRCVFNSQNAACTAMSGIDIADRCQPEAFESMFNEIVGEYNRSMLHFDGKNTVDKFATDPQAEILCYESISPDEIYACTFFEHETLNLYRDKLNAAKIYSWFKGWGKRNSAYNNYPTYKQKEANNNGEPSGI